MAAVILENFLIEFFTIYPDFKKHDFYIVGESFGGHYVPAITSRLLANNSLSFPKPVGMAIGDGWTDPVNQMYSYASYY